MTSSTTIASESQHQEGRSVRDVVETRPGEVDETWCRRILRQILQSLELQYAMHLPRRWITPDTIVFHENGEPLLLPDDLAPPGVDEAEDLTALARVIHFAITRELAPSGPLHGRVEGYSDSLTTAVDACMDPDPARRPHSIAALRELLGIVTLGPLPEAPLDLPEMDDLDHVAPAPAAADAPDPDATVLAAAAGAPPAPAALSEPASATPPSASPAAASTPATTPVPSTPVPSTSAAPASIPPAPAVPAPAPAPGLAAAAASAPAPQPAPVSHSASATSPQAASASIAESARETAAATAAPSKPAPPTPQAGTAIPPPVPRMPSMSEAAAVPPGSTPLRPGARLSRWQRWAIAAGAAAVLVAVALVAFAELRDSGSYDHIVLTLPQTGDAPQAARPQDAASAAATAPAAASVPASAPAADGTTPATAAGPGAATSLPDIDLSAPAAGAPAGGAASVAGSSAQAGNAYKVQVAPWGVVYVDGVDQGVSPPVKRLVLAPGRHTIRVTNPNFQDRVFDVDSTAGDSRIAVDFNDAR